MKILLTTAYLAGQGGVAGFYNSILPHFNNCSDIHVTVFEMGSGYNGIPRPILDQLRFFRKIFSEKFDIVHINPSLNLKSFIRDGLFIFWAKRKRLPVIVFFHGWEDSFYHKISGLLRFFFDNTYGKADQYIVLASDFKSKLIKKGIKGPIHVLTTAVDESLAGNYAVENKIHRLKTSPFTRLLFLSRIEAKKGIFETIDAFKRLIGQGYNITLTIAGDGSAAAQVKEYIILNELQDSIYMTGYITGGEKRKVFENHDIYCLPTYGEGMPISVLEAMAFGLPVITRPVGGLKDFFKNGKMGYMVQSTSPHEIAKYIKSIIDDKQKFLEIVKTNHQFAKDNFMASFVANKIADIYMRSEQY